jgi:hypothetical protein
VVGCFGYDVDSYMSYVRDWVRHMYVRFPSRGLLVRV